MDALSHQTRHLYHHHLTDLVQKYVSKQKIIILLAIPVLTFLLYSTISSFISVQSIIISATLTNGVAQKGSHILVDLERSFHDNEETDYKTDISELENDIMLLQKQLFSWQSRSSQVLSDKFEDLRTDFFEFKKSILQIPENELDEEKLHSSLIKEIESVSSAGVLYNIILKEQQKQEEILHFWQVATLGFALLFTAFILSNNRKKIWQDRVHNLKSSLEDAEKKRLAISHKYMTLYDISPDMYRTINRKGIIIDCNRAYSQVLQYTKEEVIGKSIFEHAPKDSLQNIQESFQSWLKNGSVNDKEIWLKRKDGSVFPALLSCTTIYDEFSEPVSSTIIKDMTKIHETNTKLRESEKKIRGHLEHLTEIEKQKDEFMSMITHELKTPLFPIQAHCKIIKDFMNDNLTTDQLESLDEIFKNSKKLECLISDLLDVQRIEMRKLRFSYDQINVAGLIIDIARSVRPLMEEKQINFEVSSNSNVTIHTDKDRLTQVFRNVIENAIDFVPKKGGKIEIGYESKDDKVIFFVRDNGAGIPKQKQHDLFKKFYQIDTSLRRKHGGTGLGLAICKGIIEELGGKIWVESQEKIGSTFYVSLLKTRKEIEAGSVT